MTASDYCLWILKETQICPGTSFLELQFQFQWQKNIDPLKGVDISIATKFSQKLPIIVSKHIIIQDKKKTKGRVSGKNYLHLHVSNK